ncbi:hypothetical protein AV903_15165 [Erwinia tracheiphila]|uniref:Uncharacterized protein n=1 Tax=Erwinia tracheiphila TaxID=65700 RepID=A0A345CUD9_9GAMM|nr:TA system toxin CbtA family protein [Erwinia tracheiphila]AXF77056.1 hypothetical protein AV903_15165 [Erwinia tracheiphila]
MKIQPASPKRAAQPRPSPVSVWHTLLAFLLNQHYGLTLNDTPLGNDGVIQEHIDTGISLFSRLSWSRSNRVQPPARASSMVTICRHWPSSQS